MNNNQRGSTIIIVIWILAIIGVIITFMYYRSEAELASVMSFEQKIKYRSKAEEILYQCLAELVKYDDKDEFDCKTSAWYHKGRMDTAEPNGWKITVIIQDEGSKLNINTLSNMGIAVLTQNKVSVEPFFDWRDTDNETELGAESDYYLGLKTPYKCRNGFFSSVEEIKMLKGGDKLYPLLAPEVTVHGKINPNAIPINRADDIFRSLLSSISGFDPNFDKTKIENAANEYANDRNLRTRFNRIEDIGRNSLMVFDRDLLKPYLIFDSNPCNINFVSKNALSAILKDHGLTEGVVNEIINRQKENPIRNVNEIRSYNIAYNTGNGKEFYPQDFFSVRSTIIRYQIWVLDRENTYYLDTVQERTLAGIKKQWQIHSLAWKELLNADAPELPKKVKEKDENEDQTKDSTKSNGG